MKALSIRQPWAWLICQGFKDIENRSWPTHFRGRIYVHASATPEYEEAMSFMAGRRGIPEEALKPCAAAAEWLGEIYTLWAAHQGRAKPNDRHVERTGPKVLGAIIGEVDILGCTTESDNPWFVGPYGFVLANPTAYPKPIPYRGKLGLFDVPLPREHIEWLTT